MTTSTFTNLNNWKNNVKISWNNLVILTVAWLTEKLISGYFDNTFFKQNAKQLFVPSSLIRVLFFIAIWMPLSFGLLEGTSNLKMPFFYVVKN